MSRCFRLSAAVAILVLGCAAAAGAQPFSGVVVFGDSLSDSGNLAQVLGLPAGNSATTNPDPVAAEIVATTLGQPVLPSLAGGTNFAWVGACVNPAGPCLGSAPSIAAQIGQHLALSGGRAAPGALYSIWGGANDILAAAAEGPAGAALGAMAAGAAYVRYREMLSDLQFGFPDRDLRAYVTVQNGTQHFALDSVIDAARARVLTVTLGANHRAGDRVLWGAALILGTHDNEAAAVRLDTRGAIGSLHAAVRAGNAYVHGAVSGGVADVAIGRDITIGQPAASGFFAAATAPTPGCSPVWPSSTCSPSTTGCSPRCATPSGAT